MITMKYRNSLKKKQLKILQSSCLQSAFRYAFLLGLFRSFIRYPIIPKYGTRPFSCGSQTHGPSLVTPGSSQNALGFIVIPQKKGRFRRQRPGVKPSPVGAGENLVGRISEASQ